MDFVLSLIAIIVLSPVFLVVAVLVRIKLEVSNFQAGKTGAE